MMYLIMLTEFVYFVAFDMMYWVCPWNRDWLHVFHNTKKRDLYRNILLYLYNNKSKQLSVYVSCVICHIHRNEICKRITAVHYFSLIRQIWWEY